MNWRNLIWYRMAHRFVKSIKYTWFVCRETYRRFRHDGCSTRAAALSFTSLLSLVPLLALIFIVLSVFPTFQHMAIKIQTLIIENFVATSAQIIQKHLTSFAQQASKLSAIGLFLLLVTAVLMVFNMEQAFNMIWRVKKHRRFIGAFLLYWAMLTLAPILISTGLLVSNFFASLPFIVDATHRAGIQKTLALLLPFIGTLAAFTILYIAVPNCKVRFKHGLIGGLVASVLFELAKHGFGLYISHFTNYRLLYGALSVVPIFLVWIYLSWMIILLGAVVSAVLTMSKEPPLPKQDK